MTGIPESLILLLSLGGITLLILFTITWAIQLRTGNATIVDAIWSASFPILAIEYFLMSNGYLPRALIMLAMVMIWGLRLATYLFFRILSHPEDGRYTALREKWGRNQNILMLRFFYFQAILALILSIPFAIVTVNPDPSLSWNEWAGAGLWLVSVVGESAADQQLKSFKSNPLNKGKIINQGLWYYSRHPNYFFEWLIWVSYFVFALGSPGGYLAAICPVLMIYFLLKVTGIPYTEVLMIKSRGQAYIDYQRTTSPFVPLPKRKA